MRLHLLALLLLAACRRDMADQAHHEPLEASRFFADGASARVPPAHTVARGTIGVSQPEPVTRAYLERGRERYEIYCAVCHGRTGEGNGMIVQRGFPAPPSLHLDRLRTAPDKHYFEVITKGFGVMYPYAARVEPADRWAIAAYIRALQLSQHATLAEAEPAARAKLEEGAP